LGADQQTEVAIAASKVTVKPIGREPWPRRPMSTFRSGRSGLQKLKKFRETGAAARKSV
jgi:hypothetical protein